MTGHDRWDELAAGYALHALSPEDAAAFDDHLPHCERCLASVNEHALTAAQLGSLAHSTDVAAPEWERIRDAVLGEPAAPRVLRRPVHQRRYELSRRTLAVAAGAAILAGGGVAAWRGTTGGSTPAPVSACRAASGCHVVALHESRGGKSAGSVLVSADGTMTVVPSGLTAAPAGRTYVVWQVPRDGRPQPVARFVRAGSGVRARGSLGIAYSDLMELAVSIEPDGQLPTKPSRIVAAGFTG